jgi:hypothetical protein
MNTRLTVAALLVAGLTPSMGLAIELIQQGTFVDSGGLGIPLDPNWPVPQDIDSAPDGVWWSANDRNGTWENYPWDLKPLLNSGKPHNATADNGFFAVTDGNTRGSTVLGQAFTIPANAVGITVSFDMFINDYNGQGPRGGELGPTAQTGQMTRVDILKPKADRFSTATEDLVRSLLPPSADNANCPSGGDCPNDFRRETYSILLGGTSSLMAGERYILRFGQTDNESFMNFGVDNVSIIAETPEPGALALFLSGLGALSLSFRRRLSLRR